jgi:hypothetical protein
MSMTKTIAIVILVAAGCGENERAADLKAKAEAAKAKVEAARAKVEAAKNEATAKLFDAAATALRVKGEIDKVYKATGAYDVQISAEGADDAGMKAHQEKVAAMPHVSLGDITIGYEESGEKTLNGTTFSRHFRATWVQNGQKVGLSYYTKEQLDLQAFAKLLVKFVPVVQVQLGFAG